MENCPQKAPPRDFRATGWRPSQNTSQTTSQNTSQSTIAGLVAVIVLPLETPATLLNHEHLLDVIPSSTFAKRTIRDAGDFTCFR